MTRKVPNKTMQSGFSIVGVVLIIVVLALVGLGGWYVMNKNQSKKTADTTKSQSTTAKTETPSTTDPYAGWKTATSSRAGFSIKYPADWSYSAVLGSKDNIEHIVIDSSKFHVTINSYSGKDTSNGGTESIRCDDCLQTTSSAMFTIPKLGDANLKTVTYKLDSAQGNALIVTESNSTYFIPSPTKMGIVTSFRGISILGSVQAYQAETSSEFTANPDYKTAQMILKSITY